jgi:hypothetical protein
MRRIYAELLKKLSQGKGSVIGPEARIVEDIIYEGEFVGELNDLEKSTYESVRKYGYMSKTAAEAILHTAIKFAVLFDGKVIAPEQFEAAVHRALEVFQSSLKKTPDEWSYLIRVVGFDPKSLPYTVGRVQFQVMTADLVHELGVKNELLQKTIRERYLGQIGARTIAMAVDGDAAVEIAIQEVRRALDVVNFFANRSHPPISGVHLPWEAQGSIEQFVGFQKGRGMTVHGRLKGAMVPIDLRELNGMTWFRRASDLILKDNVNAFEKRLISALQWAGRASVQERSDQAFLFYAISLENLLLGTKRDTELSYRLSIYGAHLFGADEKSRVKTHERLKNLYRLRSGIVHAGFASVGEAELSLIQQYAKYGILMFLSNESFSKMTTEEELDNYFKAKVLGEQ